VFGVLLLAVANQVDVVRQRDLFRFGAFGRTAGWCRAR